MLKFIRNINSDIKFLILFPIIMSLGTWLYMSYTSPKGIHIKYDGIKFQGGNPAVEEPITIEIAGKYQKGVRIFGEHDEFNGKVTVGDKVVEDWPLKFNKDNRATLTSNPFKNGEHYGFILKSNIFEKIAISVYTIKDDKNHIYVWSGKDDWYISAPCRNRKEAVEITNTLVQKMIKKYSVE